MDKFTSSIKQFLSNLGNGEVTSADDANRARAGREAGERPAGNSIKLREREVEQKGILAEVQNAGSEYAFERDDAWADALSQDDFKLIVSRLMGGVKMQYVALDMNTAIANFNHLLQKLKVENQVQINRVQHLGRIYVNAGLHFGPHRVLNDAQILSVLHRAVREMGDREPLRFHTYFFNSKNDNS
jgi:hypothetical protein